MTLPFNYETLKSSFDKRSTLLNQLKDMEDTFAAAGLTGIEVVDETATSLKLKMTFADGSSFTTSAIDLKGAKGDKGDKGDTGDTGPQGEPGGITNINGYTGAVTTGDGLAFNNGALSSYDLNLVDTGSVNGASLTAITELSPIGGTIYKALNADKTIGKIYGRLTVSIGTVTTAGIYYIDTGFVVSAPDNGYQIVVGSPTIASNMSDFKDTYMYIDTNGHVKVGIYVSTANTGSWYIHLPACIYFFKDFGDTPAANTLAMRMNALNPVESEER